MTQARPHRPLRALLAELWQDKPAALGLAVILAIVAMAILAPLVAPYDPADQSILSRLTPPVWNDRGSWEHILGTDNLGRDVFSRLIWGARTTLTIGGLTCLIAAGIGTVVGLWAGFMGGRTDSVLMRLVDIQVSFPGILLILLVVGVLGPGMWTLIIVLSVTNWMVYARLVRSVVSSTRQTPYVEAAEVIGCRPSRVIFVHILPNLVSPLLTLLILEFTNIVLAEAAVSFLGFGVQPPDTSWGLDVASGRDYLFIAWWLVTFPGLAIVATVLSINLFANWLRVTTDPEEREKRHARTVAARRRRRGTA
ncbi:ABC transporter permease [Allosediminivita pacifica]|uniref:Peptide/nickel transport system permease protein n=1 Tax=Allosediminivita pacifica TaxID=1267769 RepID=A0A2T6AS82_9RHOB|nr:ABC transporter permease [Allosediminivita pacifica]PTX46683.1 peptide/nickel transport system permease protein [Allosediminivita pacifica]GGB16028.1 ABC transporter permease [Allosediminivita pacifica]